jgi:hypothetical protein
VDTVEAEEEIAATAAVVGVKVDVVAEEEVGARLRPRKRGWRKEETFMLSRNDHKTTIPRFCDISGVPDMHEFCRRSFV